MRMFSRALHNMYDSGACHVFLSPGKLDVGLWCGLLVLLVPAVSCGSSAHAPAQGSGPSPSGFRIESAAFKEGASIPVRFTCEGEDISPALSWSGAPAGTRSFALIVDDPDAPAGVWTHWVVYNLPAQTNAMDENQPKQARLPNGGLQGLSSFGHVGYGGPCPPPGPAHRYFFRVYALDAVLSLEPGASKQQVLAAMKGHILGHAQLMGRFKR
jgi:Raf kinase inhibitor-like YbhB/YbcL family protein